MSDENKNSNGYTLDTQFDKNGRESAAATLASPGGIDQMFISPNQAIPVIFIPGIMGSPLIATGDNLGMWPTQGKWAWFPDSSVSWVVSGYGSLNYHQRRHLLDPNKTRAVETLGDVDMARLKEFCQGTNMPVEEAARRGWGSVMITSYGKILLHLENQMRFIFYRGNPYPGTYSAMPADPETWGKLKGYAKLSDEDLKKAAAWRFPVYAVGYNWVDSNANAAEFLKRRIDEIRHDCRSRLKLKCDKVILVTHSMGGLVGRMFAKRYQSDVLGVVHGVQPAIGAGTAYARVRGGWDSNLSVLSPIASIESLVGAWALGSTGFEVSSVFAGGAGPLELLPNHLYGSGWLQIQYGKGRSAETLFSLPKTDPYEEIYKDFSHWWRLIHPACLVAPEDRNDLGALTDGWQKYQKQLNMAQSFHKTLGTYYHPQTYAHCGADAGQPAWHRVSWQLEPLREASTGTFARKPSPIAAKEAQLTVDRMTGFCEICDATGAGDVMVNRNGVGVVTKSSGHFYRAWLSRKDNSGDATVPAHSGLAPLDFVQFFAEMQGFEHQGSYKESSVQAVTLYSMISLAANAERLS